MLLGPANTTRRRWFGRDVLEALLHEMQQALAVIQVRPALLLAIEDLGHQPDGLEALLQGLAPDGDDLDPRVSRAGPCRSCRRTRRRRRPAARGSPGTSTLRPWPSTHEGSAAKCGSTLTRAARQPAVEDLLDESVLLPEGVDDLAAEVVQGGDPIQLARDLHPASELVRDGDGLFLPAPGRLDARGDESADDERQDPRPATRGVTSHVVKPLAAVGLPSDSSDAAEPSQ